jgi:hypothetical protein
MRWIQWTASLLACATLVSCGGENQPAPTGQTRTGTLQGAVTSTPPAGQPAPAPAETRLPMTIAPTVKAAARQSDAPPPPKDAEWTLFCRSFSGPGHVEDAKNAKNQLLRLTPLKEWYLVHGDSETALYYGYYRSINNPKDPAESKRSQSDKRSIDVLQDATGDKLFPNSLFVELASPDPEAPAEWDLALVCKGRSFDDPERPFWSLQVGAYKDHPDRKKAAVEAVRAARAMGEEAYFFHGDTVSSVCIGAWPRDITAEGEATATTSDPTQPILVLDGDLPNVKGELRDRQGKRVRTFSTRLEVTDPKVRTKMQQYPYHLTNGEETVYKNAQKSSRQATFLVQIPCDGDPNEAVAGAAERRQQAQDALRGDPFGMTRTPAANVVGGPSNAPRPSASQQQPSQSGRLRSLDGGR